MPAPMEKYLAINQDFNIPDYEFIEGSEAMTYVSSLTQLSVVATDQTVKAVKRDLNFVWDELSSLGKYVEEDVYPEALQKVWVKNELTAEGEYGNLSVVKISKDDYETLVALSGDILSNNVLYIVESDYADMYGEQIKNLADGTDLSDAVNKQQLDAVAAVAGSAVQIVELSSVDGEASDEFLKKYIIKVDGTALTPEIVVPKDKVVESGILVTIVREGTDPDFTYTENGSQVTDPDLIEAIAAVYTADGKYVKISLQNANTIYIAVPELVDTYYAGTGLQLNELTRTFSISDDYTLTREQLSVMFESIKDTTTGNVKNINDIQFSDIVSCLYNIGAELYGAPAVSEPEP